jgi:hypothetical protein
MENLTGLELLGIVAVCIGVTLSFAFLVVYLIDLIDAPNFRKLRLTKVCEEKYIISYTNMYGRWRDNLYNCTDDIGDIRIHNCEGDVIERIQILSYYRDEYDARLTIDRLLNAVRKSKESKRTVIKTYRR